MEIKQYTQKEVLQQLSLMNEWVMRQFSAFPYLFPPRHDQIISVQDTIYVNEKESTVVIAKDGQKVIAVATGIALSSYYLTNFYFAPALLDNFRAQGHDPSRIWYMGYFLVAPEHQDDEKLIFSIYDLFTEFAKKNGKSQICYLDIESDDSHPLRHKNYRDPEPWGRIIKGFKDSKARFEGTWPTKQADGTVKDELHKELFFLKDL